MTVIQNVNSCGHFFLAILLELFTFSYASIYTEVPTYLALGFLRFSVLLERRTGRTNVFLKGNFRRKYVFILAI